MTLRVAVFGAGAIGGYLGVRLSSTGCAVTLVGRASLLRVADRLQAVTLDGAAVDPGTALRVTEDPAAVADADIVLVTVKSTATADAAEHLATHAKPEATIVSFQNGLANAERLRARLGPRVIAGMVSFNVIREDEGARFRQATRGPLISGPGREHHAARVEALAEAFAAADLPLQRHDDIDDVLAGKLLLNLNNGICAATGLPIAASLRSRDARWCFARCIREGQTVLRRAGRRPANVVGLPPWLIARVLTWPNAIVLRVAKRMVSIDPQARSSTLQDLDAGKATEIGELNGAIVELAERHGLEAPANATVEEIVRDLEGRSPPLPFVTPAQLRRRIAERSA